MLLLGSHVGMSGKDMLVNSVKEALSYDANTFMVYTGAPQNTRRKDISELCIPQARKLMEEHNMANFIVHAPYIINLANTVKPETYELAVNFLAKEIERTAAMGATVLVLHPGAHVGAGAEAGIAQICKGLNEVLNEDTPVFIALETMAGKGTEIGRSFEELKGKELDYSILCDLPCIFLEKNTSTRLFMDQFLSQKGIELKPEFELATSDMIVQFAKRNMGVGCVMEGFAEEAIERGEVFALSFKEKMPSRSICLVTGESGLMSMAGKHLLELLAGK